MAFVDRHVLPVESAPVLDAQGFLSLLAPGDYALYGASRPLPLDELSGTPSFVLVAPGAVGKTTALNHLIQEEADAAVVDLRARGIDDARRMLEEARAQGGAIFVDHLDEVAQSLPDLPRLLEHVVGSGDHAVSCRWRFGCRPAAWTPGLSRLMRSAMDDFVEYRLLPLSRPAAIELVRHVVEEIDAFFDALAALRSTGLPSAPHRLEALAVNWSRGEPLPVSLADAIELEVSGLLVEHDPLRQPRTLSVNRLRDLVGRLGAFATVSGITQFATGSGASALQLSPTELPDRPEPSSPTQNVTPEEYRAALATGLFDPAENGSVRFRHQQLAEYVAADYLSRRLGTVQGARNVLAMSDHGLLPSRLLGLAGWLGGPRAGVRRARDRDESTGLCIGRLGTPE